MPLILDATGKKFGKSEGNALWLDKDKTSPYEIYQYLINADDSKVFEYLKVFTFLSKEEIEEVMEEQNKKPESRIAQKTLAYEVVRDIHGKEEADNAITISKALFTGNVKSLTEEEIEVAFRGVPQIELSEETKLIDLLVNNSIASSRREAREFLNANAITLDGDIVNDENLIINKEKKYHTIRRGKKKYYLIKIK